MKKFNKTKNNIIPLIVIITSLALSHCTSVRKNYFSGSKKFQSVKISDIESSKKNINDNRFKDTTYILVADNPKVSNYINNTLIERFEKASKEFDAENYESACKTFEQLIEIFPENDSLYFESFFYSAECNMLSDNLNTAEKLLIILLQNQNTPPIVIQKSLVRLGQLYCVTDRKNEAKNIFDKLKIQYPDSIYLIIANCSAVGM
jgi:tetratricopeptide (TPR) repeat protein